MTGIPHQERVSDSYQSMAVTEDEATATPNPEDQGLSTLAAVQTVASPAEVRRGTGPLKVITATSPMRLWSTSTFWRTDQRPSNSLRPVLVTS